MPRRRRPDIGRRSRANKRRAASRAKRTADQRARDNERNRIRMSEIRSRATEDERQANRFRMQLVRARQKRQRAQHNENDPSHMVRSSPGHLVLNKELEIKFLNMPSGKQLNLSHYSRDAKRLGQIRSQETIEERKSLLTTNRERNTESCQDEEYRKGERRNQESMRRFREGLIVPQQSIPSPVSTATPITNNSIGGGVVVDDDDQEDWANNKRKETKTYNVNRKQGFTKNLNEEEEFLRKLLAGEVTTNSGENQRTVLEINPEDIELLAGEVTTNNGENQRNIKEINPEDIELPESLLIPNVILQEL